MKKIYALFAGLLIAGAVTAQRQLDMSLALNTPTEGSIVAQSATQQIKFTIQHAGDALVVGDTLLIYYYNLTQGESYSLTGVAGSASLLVMDANAAGFINANQPIPSSSINNGTDFTLNTLASGFMIGDTVLVVIEFSGLSTDPATDTLFSNDFGQFKLKGQSVSVSNLDKMELSAYPNPAISELNVVASEEVVSISVMTLDGKAVSSTKGNKVDVSNLTSGIYLYEVTTVSGLKSVSRFVKQ